MREIGEKIYELRNKGVPYYFSLCKYLSDKEKFLEINNEEIIKEYKLTIEEVVKKLAKQK